MARGRMISKSLSTSEKFASLVGTAGELAEFCQALYPLIVAHSDDFGRLQGDPFTVKHMCFPSSPRCLEQFTEGLRFLHDAELVAWYVVAGKRYLQIRQFEQHQQGLHRRTRSAFPRIPGSSGKDEETPAEQKRSEKKRTEWKGRELKSPLTPLAGGRLYSRADLKEAKRILGLNFGRCDHEPRCPGHVECEIVIATALAERRKDAAAS